MLVIYYSNFFPLCIHLRFFGAFYEISAKLINTVQEKCEKVYT